MKTIYKYPLKDLHEAIFSYKKFKPLSVQMQDDVLTLWAEVAPENDEIADTCYCYSVVGTGWPITQHVIEQKYVGTVQDKDGLVWHVFCEVGNG